MTGTPTFNMKVPDSANEVTMEKVHRQGKRTMFIVAAVFFGALVVSGITLSAVYFGSHLMHNAYKGKVTIHTANGETIQTKVEVRKEEVEMSEPGRFSVISDYKRRLSVFKVVDENSARCYVSHLNTTVVGTREDMKKRIDNHEWLLSGETPTAEYVKTKREVTPTLLSESAQIMCGGLDIEWLAPSQPGTAWREEQAMRRHSCHNHYSVPLTGLCQQQQDSQLLCNNRSKLLNEYCICICCFAQTAAC